MAAPNDIRFVCRSIYVVLWDCSHQLRFVLLVSCFTHTFAYFEWKCWIETFGTWYGQYTRTCHTHHTRFWSLWKWIFVRVLYVVATFDCEFIGIRMYVNRCAIQICVDQKNNCAALSPENEICEWFFYLILLVLYGTFIGGTIHVTPKIISHSLISHILHVYVRWL